MNTRSEARGKLSGLLGMFRHKDYRDEYVAATLGDHLAAQIFGMRKKLGWNQSELASRCETKQSRISLMEGGEYQNFTVSTLKKLASAFDVALIVTFVPFGELRRWNDELTEDGIIVPTYDEEVEREASELTESERRPPIAKRSWASARVELPHAWKEREEPQPGIRVQHAAP